MDMKKIDEIQSFLYIIKASFDAKTRYLRHLGRSSDNNSFSLEELNQLVDISEELEEFQKTFKDLNKKLQIEINKEWQKALKERNK